MENKELVPLLNELSSKLGTTVDKMFNVLMKQANVEFYKDAGEICLFIILLISGIFFITRVFKHKGELFFDTCCGGEKELNPFGFVSCVVTAIVLIFCVVGIPYDIFEMVTLKCNPEYWALGKILTGIHS